MASRVKPTVRQRRLGVELRRLRQAAGMDGGAAASVLDCDRTRISRIESGRNGIKPAEVRALCVAYGVKDASLPEALVAMAKEGTRRGWWNQYTEVFDSTFGDLADLESTAVTLRSWETILIPGLLQTEAYMTALFEGYGAVNRDEVHTLVEARKTRQAVLTGENAPEIWAVVYEAALHAHVGGRRVMREQLQHLLDVARLPNVTVQVMPYSAGPQLGFGGPFLIVGSTAVSDLEVVLLENLASSLFVEEDAQIAPYREAFDRIRAAALPPVAPFAEPDTDDRRDSLSIITHIARQL